MQYKRFEGVYFDYFFFVPLALNRGFSGFLSCSRTSKGASMEPSLLFSSSVGSLESSVYMMETSSTGPRAMALDTYFFTVKVKQVQCPTSLWTVICSPACP